MLAGAVAVGLSVLLPSSLRAQTDAQPLLIVVSADNNDAPSADEVAQIFKRRKLFWSNGARIQPVNLPADHPLRQHFARTLLHLSPEAQEEYWNEQYFHGVLPPHVLASEAAVRRFVGDTRTGIGYLSACEAGAHLRVILQVRPDGHLEAPGDLPDCR